jgi:HSP20 family molecular chaperone IbpA
MFITLKKFLFPIRHCIQLDTTSYICAVATPGFTKETIKTEITLNGLFMIDGDTKIIQDNVVVRKCKIHEAIYLPPRVKFETIRWHTENGITILRCENTPLQ